MVQNANNRQQRLLQSLAEKGLDSMLVSQPENRYYLSGFNGSAGFLLITPKDTILATDFRYVEQARQQAPGCEVVRISGDMADWVPRLASDFDLRVLGFEAGHITFTLYHQLTGVLKKAGTGLKLTATEGLVESLRAIKEPEEIALISRASEITDSAVEYILGVIRPGIIENEIAWEVERFLREHGSEVLPFDVIVASGPNSAQPHARPSERVIVSGEPVLLDIGARCGGYSSDLTRTIWIGAPDDTMRKIHDIVLGAQLTVLAIIKEGMTGGEADSIAREVIDQAGYSNAFGHSLGHGVGLATHELPRLGPKSQDRLVDGMVFTVEPGIYLAGRGGVRTEDIVVMEGGKPRLISQAKKVYS